MRTGQAMYYLLLYLIYGIQPSLYCPLPPPSLSHLYRFHTLRLAPHPTAMVPLSFAFHLCIVGYHKRSANATPLLIEHKNQGWALPHIS